MRKVTCKICGKEFETNHHIKLTCSPECSKANQKLLTAESNKKYREDKQFKEKSRAYAREHYVPRSVCRICEKSITQQPTPKGHTHKQYHDECILRDCLGTVYSGSTLSHKQQVLLYSRGYTIKELKQEFMEGQP